MFLCKIAHYGKSSVLCYYGKKNLFWEKDWALSYNSMKFWHFPDISSFPKSKVVRQLMRQLVYIMFITNNHASFKIWQIIKKSQNIMSMIVASELLTSQIRENIYNFLIKA